MKDAHEWIQFKVKYKINGTSFIIKYNVRLFLANLFFASPSRLHSVSPSVLLSPPEQVPARLLQVPLVSGEDSVAVLPRTQTHRIQLSNLVEEKKSEERTI